MTEPSGMSRRQVLKYGGLAAAVPLLPAVRPEGKTNPGGDSSLAPHLTPSQHRLTADEAGYPRVSRGGRQGASHMRCQLQFPAIRDHVDLGGDSNQTGNVISEDSHGK